MSPASNRGIRFHFVHWDWRGKKFWGFGKWYGWDSTYYGLQLGFVSFQLEKPGR